MLVREEAVPTVGETFVLVLDDKDDIISGPHSVDKRRTSYSAANFDAGLKNAGTTPKEVVANLEEHEIRDVLDTQD